MTVVSATRAITHTAFGTAGNSASRYATPTSQITSGMNR